MISLNPREQFTIVRQLEDHTDPTTYYARAVIRDSISGDTIQTVNLNDDGNGRFTRLWEVPSDVSGLGFYIDITISVYSDSGYTTKASAYGDSNEQYLVFERRPASMGGGGGADVDYKKIEKMLQMLGEEIRRAMPEKANFGPLTKILKDMNASIAKIEIPENEAVELTPVLEAIRSSEKNIVKSIAEKEVTPEMELDEVLKSIADLKAIMSDFVTHDMQRELGVHDSAQGKLKDLAGKILPLLNEYMPAENKPRDRVRMLLD